VRPTAPRAPLPRPPASEAGRGPSVSARRVWRPCRPVLRRRALPSDSLWRERPPGISPEGGCQTGGPSGSQGVSECDSTRCEWGLPGTQRQIIWTHRRFQAKAKDKGLAIRGCGPAWAADLVAAHVLESTADCLTQARHKGVTKVMGHELWVACPSLSQSSSQEGNKSKSDITTRRRQRRRKPKRDDLPANLMRIFCVVAHLPSLLSHKSSCFAHFTSLAESSEGRPTPSKQNNNIYTVRTQVPYERQQRRRRGGNAPSRKRKNSAYDDEKKKNKPLE